MEEPELHLNTQWVKQILPLFAYLLYEYDIHFLISSHDYSLINCLFNYQVLILYQEKIEQPRFNTFLADDKVIYYELVKKHEFHNDFQISLYSMIEKMNACELFNLYELLGESFLKVIVFKKLVELGEIDVED